MLAVKSSNCHIPWVFDWYPVSRVAFNLESNFACRVFDWWIGWCLFVSYVFIYDRQRQKKSILLYQLFSANELYKLNLVLLISEKKKTDENVKKNYLIILI